MSTEKIINPATGEVIQEVALTSREDIERTIKLARQAFDTGPWGQISLSERKQFLLKIAQGILEAAAELAELETKNTGKPIKESTFMDIPSSAKTFEYFAHHLEQFLQPKQLDLEEGNRGDICYEPRGVSLLIVPWNYPLLIAAWKIAQSLAAGNTVILKPSSRTPLTALKLAEVIKAAGLPEGVVNVVNARGQDIGAFLCAHPCIDMISFTGSTHSGQQLMRYAATGTKKMILELGGKSAAVILADCNLEITAQGALAGIFLNQGQMCTAMSRILVDKKIAKEFIEQFMDRAQKIKLGNGLDPQTQMGPLIADEQRKKVAAFVAKGKQQGAKLLCGGRIPEDPELRAGFFFEPTVFTQVGPEMSIFQEEIFGPLACVSEFSTEEEAIQLANNSTFGLACSIWSRDLDKAKKIGARINAGTVWINTYGMFYNQAPYGGFKASGFGKELGQEGFLEYCRSKQISYNSAQDHRPLVSDWYAF